jgi:hypothetical protein
VRVELGDDDQRWLRLRVTPNGVVSWTLLCKGADGRTRRFMLGSYPGLGLSAARAKARTLRERVRDGFDPIHEGRVARSRREIEGRSNALTMVGLFDLYEAKGGGSEKKSWAVGRKRITNFFSKIGDVALSDMRLSDLQRVVDDAKSWSSAGFAVRTIGPVLKWASAPGRGLCSEELTKVLVPAGGKLKRRQRVLNLADGELSKVWSVLCAREGESHADCMRFILLTLMRRGEAEAVRWKDVDWDAETVRLAVTKNGRAHVVPLSKQALEVLRTRYKRHGENLELVFPSEAWTVPGNWDRALRMVHRVSGTKGWHLHDLRRTGATMLGEMGVEPYIIEAALNHVRIHSALAATYNVARYRDAVRGALGRLGEKLASLG